jgi:hypothetical protein
MLFRKEFLDGIRAGTVTLAFRRWHRPSVKGGGTLLTPVGQLRIKSVEPVSMTLISAEDARRAGYDSRASLQKELRRRPGGTIYRIELGSLRSDPRIALRQRRVVSEVDLQDLQLRLGRLDAHASDGPWTLRVLKAVRSHPGVRAADVCGLVRQEKERFKLNVRKLKNLGLTESLGTGYRLSTRGETLLSALDSESSGNASPGHR